MSRSFRKRVLFVGGAPGFGGSFVFAHSLLKGLDRERFEPIVLFYGYNQVVPQLEKLGIRVRVLNVLGDGKPPSLRPRRKTAFHRWLGAIPGVKGALYFVRFVSLFSRRQLPMAFRLRKIIREERVDLVHLNDEPVYNRDGILACRLAGVPCVCHVHQADYPNLLDRIISGGVDYVIYNSGAMQRYWQERVKFPRQRVIHNGLDLQDFSVGGERSAVRRELTLEPDDFVVLSVGRITEWKGHRVLLRALALARADVPNLICLVVGAPGSDADFRYQEELRQLRDSLGLSSIVRFLGHRSDVGRVLAASDVMAHTSTSPEPFGLVIIEGMAASLPVIATKDGGVPEIIDDGENGILTPPGDPQALARALTAVASDKTFARRLGMAARSRVLERFTLERVAREVEAVYEAVLN